MSKFSGIVVEILARGASDHCPQLLRFEKLRIRHGLFKFYNIWTEHEHYEQLIRDNWRNEKNQIQLQDF